MKAIKTILTAIFIMLILLYSRIEDILFTLQGKDLMKFPTDFLSLVGIVIIAVCLTTVIFACNDNKK